MDRHSEINDDQLVSTFRLSSDDLMLILEALDVYGYALLSAQAQAKFLMVRTLALEIVKNMPKPELDS